MQPFFQNGSCELYYCPHTKRYATALRGYAQGGIIYSYMKKLLVLRNNAEALSALRQHRATLNKRKGS
jgi:hypothetical protein